MKTNPKMIALAQALGLALYVVVIATLINTVTSALHPVNTNPVMGITLFLMLFVLSAFVSGSIVLGYPGWLFFSGKKELALHILGWTIVWLILIILLIGFIFLNRSLAPH